MRLAALLSAISLTACGPDSAGQAAPGTPGDDVEAPGPGLPSPGGSRDAGPRRDAVTRDPDLMADGFQCGEETFRLEPGLPPEVLIAFDRSGSMNECADGSSCDGTSGGDGTRWRVMTQALAGVVTNTQAAVSWGLALFPSDGACGAGAPEVGVAPMSAAQVVSTLAAREPGGNTPIRAAVDAARQSLAARTTPNPKYLLLATDGAPNCSDECACPDGGPQCAPGMCMIPFLGCSLPCVVGGPDVRGAVDACAAAAAAGVRVIVIGLGLGDGVLDDLAVAGGAPRQPGPPHHYRADSGAELEAALLAITGQIASCTYPLRSVPPEPGQVSVSVNGMLVARDAANGWELSPDLRAIVFNGDACRLVQSTADLQIHATFGCPPIGKPAGR